MSNGEGSPRSETVEPGGPDSPAAANPEIDLRAELRESHVEEVLDKLDSESAIFGTGHPWLGLGLEGPVARASHVVVSTRIRDMDGRPPMELIRTDAGARIVENLLARISWGAPS